MGDPSSEPSMLPATALQHPVRGWCGVRRLSRLILAVLSGLILHGLFVSWWAPCSGGARWRSHTESVTQETGSNEFPADGGFPRRRAFAKASCNLHTTGIRAHKGSAESHSLPRRRTGELPWRKPDELAESALETRLVGQPHGQVGSGHTIVLRANTERRLHDGWSTFRARAVLHGICGEPNKTSSFQ